MVVAYGYPGASRDPEALATTGLSFDAVLGELAAVAGCQPKLTIGDINVEPSLSPCLLKGIRNGIWGLVLQGGPRVSRVRGARVLGARVLPLGVEETVWLLVPLPLRRYSLVRLCLIQCTTSLCGSRCSLFSEVGHSACNQILYTKCLASMLVAC